MPAESTIAKAIDSLDRMAHVVSLEAIVRGTYVDRKGDPNLSDSICGGNRYCALGSLWVGAGCGLKRGRLMLDGVFEDDRQAFLRPRHGLRLAYDALNAAADRYIDAYGIDRRSLNIGANYDAGQFSSSLEALFEEGESVGHKIGVPELLAIVSDAKRALMAQVTPIGMPETREVERV